MLDTLIYVFCSILGGTMTGIVTVAVLKTDVKWLSKNVDNLSKRVYNIERNIVLKEK